VQPKPRAPRNRTLTLSAAEQQHYQQNLLQVNAAINVKQLVNRTICQNLEQVLGWLPTGFVDLLFIDPPYNLDKIFGQARSKLRSPLDYEQWVETWFCQLMPLLKPNASVYVCSDWQTSLSLYQVASRHLKIRNRITWEREKGRAAQRNWKNCAEDIWFCTVGSDYYFDREAVRLKRQVRAPYTNAAGQPKDWQQTANGNYRLTAASNLWTDITVPFWSMPENTDHPTQKPEKLLAKIILASSPPGGLVFDPFLGSGTTSVVAKKLGRQYVGIEIDPVYACLAEKRLALAEQQPQIQGYEDGVFWERNTTAKHFRT
jgi:site-specific DNA-methyltransferase (adenine-specific)